MSFSSVGGGFQGADALLAFAAVQQGRMNDEMTDAMRIADLRSQMAGDLADIKSHLEQANRHPETFGDVDAELQAFMEKYGSVPELEDVTSTVGGIAANVHGRWQNAEADHAQAMSGYGATHAQWKAHGSQGEEPQPPGPTTMGSYNDKTIQSWLGEITDKLDAAGTNDQLTMIHIKTLNDNISNSSGMVSGIIESRQNSTASIINNIA
jgi:hypothetical protein